MLRASGLLGVLAMLLLVSWLMAADSKTDTDKKDPDPKAKGTLRPNWKKLGLTDDQTQKIYKVQSDYRAKIDVLEQQIKDLRQQELTDQVKVLTEAQKARLKELGEFKDPTDPAKTDPAKTDPDKKDDVKKDDTKKDDVKKP
jgi:Spy/CpxP family protein refolding chaperone